MICLMSIQAFGFCYTLAGSYMALLVLGSAEPFARAYEESCVAFVDGKEIILPYNQASQHREFYGCGNAFSVIGKYE